MTLQPNEMASLTVFWSELKSRSLSWPGPHIEWHIVKGAH